MVKTKTSSKHQNPKKENFLRHWYKPALGVFLFALTASMILATAETHSASTVPTGSPIATDTTQTQYGSIGKWMLKSDGKISNWGGKKHQNKTLLEVVNVVIADQTSKTAAASIKKVENAISKAGFPSRFGHSVGFKGMIDGKTYGQKPGGLNAYSNKSFFVQNDHGRLFGPAPAASGGFVWSGAFSNEDTTLFLGIPIGHSYTSFNIARDKLAQGFVASGQARAANIDLNNAYNTSGITTGDHDGKAIVIILK